MGYYAWSTGEVKLKIKSAKELLAAYDELFLAEDPFAEDLIETIQEKGDITPEKFFSLWCEYEDTFYGASADVKDGNVLVLDMSSDGNYYEDCVVTSLSRLAPVAIEGNVTFCGDADEQWRFHFENGRFDEYRAEIRYACEFPRCSHKTCVFSDGERCRFRQLRPDSKAVIFEIVNETVVNCNAFVQFRTVK